MIENVLGWAPMKQGQDTGVKACRPSDFLSVMRGYIIDLFTGEMPKTGSWG